MIKLLITTDFHANRKALTGLNQLLKQGAYSGVLMLGDLINPRISELPYAEQYIELVKAHQLPLFGLHGNNEPFEAYQLYRESGINIHLETRQLGDYTICGIGGFGMLDEPGFEDLSINNLVINKQTIFITHVPPKASQPVSMGPLVHLFGHRHSLAYTKEADTTLQVQCPAGNLYKATELLLPELRINFIDIPLA